MGIESYPPTGPVSSVDGKTGAVSLSATYSPALAPSGVTPTGVGRFEPSRSVYGLSNANMRKIRAALAAARTTNGYARLAWAGDSTSKGTGAASTAWTWPRQLGAMLASLGYPYAGDIGYTNASAGITDARWSFGAGWTAYTGDGVSANFYQATTTNAATYTSDNSGTVVKVKYLNNFGDPFTVTIDGTPHTVTPNGSSTFGVFTQTGLADSTHTVVITPSTTTFLMIVYAAVLKSSGVVIADSGMGGAQSGNWQDGTWYFQANEVANEAPDALFVMLGINDLAGSIPLATYKSNIDAIIAKFTALGTSVILVCPQPASGRAIDTIRTQLLALADSRGVPMIDMLDRWSDYTTASGLGLTFNGDHPNTPGYSDVAAAAAAVLLG